MSQTTSDTVTVGSWTYIFINEVSTTYIEFYRFKDNPSNVQKGKVGKSGQAGNVEVVQVAAGALAATQFSEGLRLYYIVNGDRVHELCLDNAGDDNADLTKAWYDGNYNTKMSQQNATNNVTFLSAGQYRGRPMALYEAPKDKNTIFIAFQDEQLNWSSSQVDRTTG